MKKYQREIEIHGVTLSWWKAVISLAVTILMLGLALYHNDLFKKSEDIYIASGWKETRQTQDNCITYQLDFKAKYKYLTSVHILFALEAEDSHKTVENIELINTET